MNFDLLRVEMLRLFICGDFFFVLCDIVFDLCVKCFVELYVIVLS